MILGTTYIRKDEPCLGLFELNYQPPDSSGFRRYQIVLVMRGDKGDQHAEFRKDLGKAKKWKGVDQFRIPGGIYDGRRYQICHTVGELQDIANQLRAGKTLFDKLDLLKVNKIKE